MGSVRACLSPPRSTTARSSATLTGTDRPGVTAAVLGAMAGRGLEVLDVEQHVVPRPPHARAAHHARTVQHR
ncbi:MAG: hypothetical protein PGN11_07505 [Quadrisphaera sp.]